MPASAKLHWAVLGRVGERYLLLPTHQVREVLPMGPLSPLPAPVPNLQGVIIHQGELLPVLDWSPWSSDCTQAQIAVLRCRIGIPMDRLEKVVDVSEQHWIPMPHDHPWVSLCQNYCLLEEPTALLDLEKLLAVLQNRNLRHG